MKVERSALLPYSASEVYAVIKDVRSYPEFLNWCSDVVLLDESDVRQVAELKIAYKRLRFSFSTANQLVQDQSISMQLLSGPFKDLRGEWLIQPLGESACKIALYMNFTFDNPITHRLFGKVFQQVVSAQIEAFQKRTEYLYGTL